MFAKRPRLTSYLILYVGISLCLMQANSRLPSVKAWRSKASALITPLFYMVDAPTDAIEYAKDSLVSRWELQQENSKLHAQELILRAQLQKFIALQKENEQLRALLASTPPQGGRMMAAQLLAVAHDPYTQTIVLDKGANQKVVVGQPVLDANGIMGQIIEVSPLTSRVLLLTDTQSAIPVQVARSSERGIVVGDGASGYLKLIHIPQTTEILIGDILVTSGLGRRYPAGYPVGTVESVVRKPGEPFSEIRLRPAAQVNRSRLVLLFWLDQSDQKINAQIDLRQKQSGQKDD